MFPFHFANDVKFIIGQQWALVISGNNSIVHWKRHSLQERKWDFVILMNTYKNVFDCGKRVMTVAANVKQIIHPDISVTAAAAALFQPKTTVNNSRIFIVKF